MRVLASNTSGTSSTPAPQGRPRIGRELGRGAEGIVYENLDQPGWAVKVFHMSRTSPLQARNEFQNLEKARAIHPNNVVKAQTPADPRQGWLVKEEVISTNVPEDWVQKTRIILDFQPIPDSEHNLMWGITADNPTPRWLLIE